MLTLAKRGRRLQAGGVGGGSDNLVFFVSCGRGAWNYCISGGECNALSCTRHGMAPTKIIFADGRQTREFDCFCRLVSRACCHAAQGFVRGLRYPLEPCAFCFFFLGTFEKALCRGCKGGGEGYEDG